MNGLCRLNYFCLTSVTVAAMLCAAPNLLHAQSEGQTVIGNFTGSFEANLLELHSIYDPVSDHSDLALRERSSFRIYQIQASSGGEAPILDVALQEGGGGGGLKIISVTLLDDGYETALAAAQMTAAGVVLESYGAIDVETLALESDGAISFSFSADLIRIDLQSEVAIADAPGARIEGQFSGTFPASEFGE